MTSRWARRWRRCDDVHRRFISAHAGAAPAFAAAQGRTMPERLSPVGRLQLPPDERTVTARGPEAGAMPVELGAERRLLHRHAAAAALIMRNRRAARPLRHKGPACLFAEHIGIAFTGGL